MGKASRNKKGRGQSSATATEASGSDAGQSSASGAPPSEVPPPSQPFQVPLQQGISGDALVKMVEDLVEGKITRRIDGQMENLVEGKITRRLPRIIEAVLKVVSASFQAAIDKEVEEKIRVAVLEARAADTTRIKNLLEHTSDVIKNHLADLRPRVEKLEGDTATQIKNLSDGLGDLKSEVAQRFDKLHTKDLQPRVEKLEGDAKAEIKNLGEEVENLKVSILEIGELRALIEKLVKGTEQVPESIRRHISMAARSQYDDLTRKQASAFTEEFCRSGVQVIQAAMDDFLRSSLLPDLKNSLEDTIERQIVRGIATIASQHSKFEVSLSQKFQGYVDAVWTTTNSLKSLLADFRSQDLSFRIPNPEEAFSSGAKDQEHSSVGKDSSVQITTTEGASSSGAKD